jgi:hypothetical protein
MAASMTTEFVSLATVLFLLSACGDGFRPAGMVAISHFSTKENYTRSVSLYRLAINLGFSIGPALGGLLAAVDYQWLFSDGGSSAEMHANHIFDTAGVYYITLIAEDAKGCKDTITKQIIIKEELYIYIPNTFIPDDDRFNNFFLGSFVGVAWIKLEVFNRWGQQVFSTINPDIGWNGLIRIKTMTALDRCAAAFNTWTGSPITHPNGINLKTFTDDFRVLSEYHKQIQSFGFGDMDDFIYWNEMRLKQDNNHYNSPYYPYFYVVPQDVTQKFGFMEYKFTFITSDIIQRDLANQNDVLSDTLQIMEEF